MSPTRLNSTIVELKKGDTFESPPPTLGRCCFVFLKMEICCHRWRGGDGIVLWDWAGASIAPPFSMAFLFVAPARLLCILNTYSANSLGELVTLSLALRSCDVIVKLAQICHRRL